MIRPTKDEIAHLLKIHNREEAYKGREDEIASAMEKSGQGFLNIVVAMEKEDRRKAKVVRKSTPPTASVDPA